MKLPIYVLRVAKILLVRKEFLTETQNSQDKCNYNEKKKLVHKEMKNVNNKYWEEKDQDINLEACKS